MEIRTSIADEINRHHEVAIAKANEAMSHAIEAGKLLIEVKAALPHGEFGEWMEKNVNVSVRQSQRYMAAAQGKQVPIRAISSKYDTVSHLPAVDQQTKTTDDWPAPTWEPTAGHWMLADVGDSVFHVVPSLEHPGFFHISKFYSSTELLKVDAPNPDWDGESYFDGTKRPVRPDAVEMSLQCFGMGDPSQTAWSSKAHDGLSRPFGEPEAGLDVMRGAIDGRWSGPPHWDK